MEERAQQKARVIYNKSEREEGVAGEKNRREKKSTKVREPSSVVSTHFQCVGN